MRVLKAMMLSTALLMPLGALAEVAPTPSLITVTGEGVIEGAPDMATLTLGVTTQADTAREAMSANTAAMQKIVARLKETGIDERDMQTSNLTIDPNWSKVGYVSGSGQQISSYTVGNQLTIRVRAVDSVGVVLDAAITDGVNTLRGLTFGMADPKPGLEAARKAAALDARAKADLLVAALGVRVGRVVSISESGGVYQPGPMNYARMSDSAEVPVQGGEVSITANVTVVFEIEQ